MTAKIEQELSRYNQFTDSSTLPPAPAYQAAVSSQWFHIYRENICDRNAFVKHQDKNEVKFYVEFHYRSIANIGSQFSRLTYRRFEFNFYWLDKNGPKAFTIKPILQKTNLLTDLLITDFSTGKEIIINRGSTFGRKYLWEMDGIQYQWKGALFNTNLELTQLPEKKVVAVYHRAARFSFKKEGKLEVKPEYNSNCNLIIATAFAAELWEDGDEAE